jgi:hypothetical protein
MLPASRPEAKRESQPLFGEVRILTAGGTGAMTAIGRRNDGSMGKFSYSGGRCVVFSAVTSNRMQVTL